ncbi:transposable element Tcb1 transposase [Trichonephila clavipes]|nr:transposable element Tcb1 transposase [Trichonephila clavipes]
MHLVSKYEKKSCKLGTFLTFLDLEGIVFAIPYLFWSLTYTLLDSENATPRKSGKCKFQGRLTSLSYANDVKCVALLRTWRTIKREKLANGQLRSAFFQRKAIVKFLSCVTRNVYSTECQAAVNGGISSRQTTLRGHLQDTLDVPISTGIISRRLVESGLHSRRPLRTLALIPQRRRARLEWCRARATWMTERRNVVFSDESRFCFFNDSQRIRVWRRRGERSNPAVNRERPQRGIMPCMIERHL